MRGRPLFVEPRRLARLRRDRSNGPELFGAGGHLVTGGKGIDRKGRLPSGCERALPLALDVVGGQHARTGVAQRKVHRVCEGAIGAGFPVLPTGPGRASEHFLTHGAEDDLRVFGPRRISDPWIADNRPGGYDRLTLPASTGILAAVDGRTGRIAWKQEFSGGRLGLSGPLTTAGNLMFWGSADGQVEAYDARTGERVWAFQTLASETRLRPGPASTYAVGGRQFVVISMGPEIWAFALDGTVSARSAPDSIELDDLTRWVGPAPRPVDTIETAMLRESCCAVGGERGSSSGSSRRAPLSELTLLALAKHSEAGLLQSSNGVLVVDARDL